MKNGLTFDQIFLNCDEFLFLLYLYGKQSFCCFNWTTKIMEYPTLHNIQIVESWMLQKIIM